jgi:hypothetical protein
MVFLSLRLFFFENTRPCATCSGLTLCYPKFKISAVEWYKYLGLMALCFITPYASLFLLKLQPNKKYVFFSVAASSFEN